MPQKQKLRLETITGYLKECLAQRDEAINKLMRVMAGPN